MDSSANAATSRGRSCHNPTAADANPAVLTEVTTECLTPPSFRGSVSYLAAILAGVLTGAASSSRIGTGPLMWCLEVGTIGLLVFLLNFHRNRRARNRAWLASLQLVPLGSADFVRVVVERSRKGGAVASVREALQVLLAHGQHGTTIRAGALADRVRPAPLTFPFEPQPLNEALSTLMDAQARAQAAGEPDRPPTGPQSSFIAQLVQRNVALNGGRLLIALFALSWVTSLHEAISKRELSPYFIFITLALPLMLFWPNGPRWLSRQWFLVPGGLVLRRAPWFQRHWTLHLFNRQTSVLLVGRLHRQRWGLFVADNTRNDYALITEDEAQFVLRAWLSPLPPPPLDRLADLQ